MPWRAFRSRDGRQVSRPVVHVLFEGRQDVDLLLLDSGADFSMAPVQLAIDLGIDTSEGLRLEMRGISPRPECFVEARVVDVRLRIMPRGWELKVPFAFAEGNVPLLAGRYGFLERLEVVLQGSRQSSLLRLL